MKKAIKWISFTLLLAGISVMNSGCIRASVALGGDADREAPNQFFGPSGAGAQPSYYPSPYDTY